ncbi:conserved exported hypothetical protein [Flavobacterium sp. 9AF]|uniref:hypothetical protein n=1 Tax=Flavobacterium sp. 9AF TaxID=2653142 RepID=UPI0012F16850|nr:hypothetical protein [Flavobacterium sp. 9AF]VXB34435.1 conserved exported hypothetical protein [Flavobacterium sp. 9AF]
MKKIILLFTLLITTFGFAQTANKTIAWSGIIADNSGNALANTNVTLKFSITQNGTPFFSEQHIKTTDANGFVNANIGEGTPLINNLSIVYFDTVDLKLKIEVDSGSGFVTLSDEFFKAVPYAKGAETARELGKNDEFILLNSNNVSFYTNGYQGEINENGLLLDDLAGTGTREVVADANGQLQRKPVQVKYLSISGAEFSQKENFRYYHNTGLYSIVADNYSTVNVNFPDKVKVTEIKVIFKDNSTANIGLDLVRIDNSVTNNPAAMWYYDTTNSPSFQIITDTFSNFIVNNELYSYYFRILSNNWDGNGNNAGIRAIIFKYEE